MQAMQQCVMLPASQVFGLGLIHTLQGAAQATQIAGKGTPVPLQAPLRWRRHAALPLAKPTGGAPAAQGSILA
jgi:hypothetical protein